MRGHGHQRGRARLGDRTEGFLNNIGESAALVAGRGIGTAVGFASRKVFVIPAHLTDQGAAHFDCRGTRCEQVDGIPHLGHFREHDGCTGAHQQVRRIANGGVAGDS